MRLNRIILLLPACLVLAACVNWFPSVSVAYRGNGDERILAFMRGMYMSSEEGVARYLRRELEHGLQPGQGIDRDYLARRGAICAEGAPQVCRFNGVADEHFRGMPKENARRARRITTIEARVILEQPVRIEVSKTYRHPDEE